MTAIGVRCSNTDYVYCVLSGARTSPALVTTKQVSFPADYSEAENLRWLHQEMQAVFKEHKCDSVGIKKAEATVPRSNALEARMHCEAVVALAAAESGCISVCWKVKATLAKDLGLKGKAKYLETKLDTSPISGFNEYSGKVQEAILAAWSCM